MCDKQNKEIVPKHQVTRGFLYVHVYSISTWFSMVREFIPHIQLTFTFHDPYIQLHFSVFSMTIESILHIHVHVCRYIHVHVYVEWILSSCCT